MQKYFTKLLGIIAIALLSAKPSSAQVIIEDTASAATLVQMLVGTGITYANPVLNCPPNASGNFDVVSSNLGIGDGIILTSGRAKTMPPLAGANGPQNSFFAATSNNAPGDPELTALYGIQTFDACILEFDFVPDGDSLLFDYVFGSEEYDSYSCSSFNDLFAFFLSGPGIPGTPNIAMIPGTNIPVTINSTTNPAITQPFSLAACQAMGPGSPFAQYYNDNSAGQTITYYGMTTVLTARAAVIPCTTYHIKLVVADGADGTLDSGVFLEANSFRSTNIKLALNSSLGSKYDYLVEGCTFGQVTTKRNTAFPISQTVHLGYGGTAIKGVDYPAPPDSVVIPANDTISSFIIQPFQDNTAEGFETIIVYVLNPCNNAVIDSIIFNLYDYLPYTLLSDDTTLCGGNSVRLEVDGDTDFTWYWRTNPANNHIQNTASILTYDFPDSTTTYYVSATYNGCVTDTQTFTAFVEPIPIVDIVPEDTTICFDKPMQLEVELGPAYFPNYSFIWAPNTYLSDPFIQEPLFYTTIAGDYKYILAVQTPLGCTGKDSVLIHARPATVLINVTGDQLVKYGASVQLNAEGALYYTWLPDNWINYPNTNNPIITPYEPVTLTVIGMNEYGCKDTAYVKLDIDYTMFEILPSAFSPNGDGRNDVFKITNLKFQRIIEFRIFNRYGQEVFSTNDAKVGWDGTYKGAKQEIGVYHYLIRAAIPDGTVRTYKGDVTLIR